MWLHSSGVNTYCLGVVVDGAGLGTGIGLVSVGGVVAGIAGLRGAGAFSVAGTGGTTGGAGGGGNGFSHLCRV